MAVAAVSVPVKTATPKLKGSPSGSAAYRSTRRPGKNSESPGEGAWVPQPRSEHMRHVGLFARPSDAHGALPAHPGTVAPEAGSFDAHPLPDDGRIGVDGVPGGVARGLRAEHEDGARSRRGRRRGRSRGGSVSGVCAKTAPCRAAARRRGGEREEENQGVNHAQRQSSGCCRRSFTASLNALATTSPISCLIVVPTANILFSIESVSLCSKLLVRYQRHVECPIAPTAPAPNQ